MLDHSTGNAGRHSLADRQDDLYETHPVAVKALLGVEPLPKKIWEPACGRGAIASVLVEAGHDVRATDLVNYGYGIPRVDFLMETYCSRDSAIVTNPPYKLATSFVRHALLLNPGKVVMLLRLAFLEGTGRSDILDGGRLARVHVFRNRLPMMHRDGWQGPKASSSVAFAWFVWERQASQTIINRISWEG